MRSPPPVARLFAERHGGEGRRYQMVPPAIELTSSRTGADGAPKSPTDRARRASGVHQRHLSHICSAQRPSTGWTPASARICRAVRDSEFGAPPSPRARCAGRKSRRRSMRRCHGDDMRRETRASCAQGGAHAPRARHSKTKIACGVLTHQRGSPRAVPGRKSHESTGRRSCHTICSTSTRMAVAWRSPGAACCARAVRANAPLRQTTKNSKPDACLQRPPRPIALDGCSEQLETCPTPPPPSGLFQRSTPSASAAHWARLRLGNLQLVTLIAPLHFCRDLCQSARVALRPLLRALCVWLRALGAPTSLGGGVSAARGRVRRVTGRGGGGKEGEGARAPRGRSCGWCCRSSRDGAVSGACVRALRVRGTQPSREGRCLRAMRAAVLAREADSRACPSARPRSASSRTRASAVAVRRLTRPSSTPANRSTSPRWRCSRCSSTVRRGGAQANKRAGVESDFVLLFALAGGLPLAGGATVARVWVSLDDPGPGSRVLSPGSHRSP